MATTGFLPRTLKSRMTAVVILLVLAATTIVTILALMLAERDMKAVIGSQQYAVLSSAAAYVDEQLETKRALLSTLPEGLPPGAQSDPSALQALLLARPAVSAEFYNVVAFDRKGRMVATLRSDSKEPSVDATGRPYFDQTIRQRKGLISAPLMSRLSGRPIVVMTQPVLDQQGEVAYVIAASIDLQQSDFFGPINALKPGKTGFMFIMTAGGILIHHPTQERLLHHINERPGHNRATEMALNGFEGWTEARNKDGSEGIYSYKRLKTTSWIVAARFPTDEAFAPLIELRRQAIFAASVFAAVAGLLAWLVIHRLLAPLQRLHSRVATLRQGGGDIASLRSMRKDEIGELGEAFYQLTAERAVTQDRVLASERRSRMIADNMPALVAYIDCDLRYRFTNEHYQQLLGVDPAAMLGKTISEVFGADVYAHWKDRIDAALRGERVHEERDSLEMGRMLHLMVDLVPDMDADGTVQGFYLMSMDITERRNAELTQAASEKRLRLITDHLPALVAYIDREYLLRFGNATFKHWMGLEPASLVARPLADVMGATAFAKTLPHLEQAFSGVHVSFEHRARLHGDLRTLETTFVPDQRADGSVAGVYSLTRDMSHIKAVEQQLIELARIDPLTGIANRRKFEEVLQQAMARSQRLGRRMALAYLDIDNFKTINDSLGHGGGDEVLKEFAGRLTGAVRAVDLVARLAGDEFIIVFENVDEVGEAAQLAAKIVATVRDPFTVAGAAMQVTTSVGLALFDGGSDNDTQSGLIARADHALYAAKRNGRDCYVVDAQAV